MKYAIIHSNTASGKRGWSYHYVKYEEKEALTNHIAKYYKNKNIDVTDDLDAGIIFNIIGKKKFDNIKEIK